MNGREVEGFGEKKRERRGGRQFGGGVIQRMRGTALPLSPLLLRVEIHPSGGAADICVEDLAEYGTCPAAEAPRSDSSSPVHGCSGRTGGSARIQTVILPEKSSPFFILSTFISWFFSLQDFFCWWFNLKSGRCSIWCVLYYISL